jgi:hypothetical protein
VNAAMRSRRNIARLPIPFLASPKLRTLVVVVVRRLDLCAKAPWSSSARKWLPVSRNRGTKVVSELAGVCIRASELRSFRT